jgi:hypothetical protein
MIPGLGGRTSNENNGEHINCMKRKLSILCLILTLGGLVRAQDAKPDPTGAWKVTQTQGTNSTNKQTQKLELEGDKLTGTLSRQAGYKIEQLPLEDGRFKGNEISFSTHCFAVSYVNKVLQPTDTNKVAHSKFQGTISGDTIEGKVERDGFTGNRYTLDWEARRVKATTQ